MNTIDFDGTVNHIVLLGVLESDKHGILGTADMMAASEMLSSTGVDGDVQTPVPSEPVPTASVEGE